MKIKLVILVALLVLLTGCAGNKEIANRVDCKVQEGNAWCEADASCKVVNDACFGVPELTPELEQAVFNKT